MYIRNCKFCQTAFACKKVQDFCCRSHAASFNNKLKPKRKAKPSLCKSCNAPLPKRRLCCESCKKDLGYSVDWNKETLGCVKKRTKYQAHARVRDLARNIYRKSTKPKFCIRCKYDLHYDICHVKSIESHSDDTPIAVINNISNLIALCKNCHWEFDNGYLSLRDLPCQ